VHSLLRALDAGPKIRTTSSGPRERRWMAEFWVPCIVVMLRRLVNFYFQGFDNMEQ
jgi:hypothetical protein